jgi:hypothetical protein
VIWPHRLDLLGGLNRRLDARRRVAVVGICTVAPTIAPVEIDGMLGLVRQVRAAVFSSS